MIVLKIVALFFLFIMLWVLFMPVRLEILSSPTNHIKIFAKFWSIFSVEYDLKQQKSAWLLLGCIPIQRSKKPLTEQFETDFTDSSFNFTKPRPTDEVIFQRQTADKEKHNSKFRRKRKYHNKRSLKDFIFKWQKNWETYRFLLHKNDEKKIIAFLQQIAKRSKKIFRFKIDYCNISFGLKDPFMTSILFFVLFQLGDKVEIDANFEQESAFLCHARMFVQTKLIRFVRMSLFVFHPVMLKLYYRYWQLQRKRKKAFYHV